MQIYSKDVFVYAVTQTLSSFRTQINITNHVLEIIQYQHN